MKIPSLDEVQKSISFDVISENWNEYELEDQTIIRCKNVLVSILDAGPAEEETETSGLRKAFFDLRLMSSVFSPKAIRGEKGKSYPISELEKFKIKKNLKFRQIKDAGFSKYETEKSIINIKIWLKQVDKTSKFDNLGNPAYIIRTESQILVEQKPTVTGK